MRRVTCPHCGWTLSEETSPYIKNWRTGLRCMNGGNPACDAELIYENYYPRRCFEWRDSPDAHIAAFIDGVNEAARVTRAQAGDWFWSTWAPEPFGHQDFGYEPTHDAAIRRATEAVYAARQWPQWWQRQAKSSA